jgi:hypothetical protein
MTESNQNDPVGTTPVKDPSASWGWLQERVDTASIDSLNEWLENQLLELEETYADLVTAESLKLSLRSELRQSRQ